MQIERIAAYSSLEDLQRWAWVLLVGEELHHRRSNYRLVYSTRRYPSKKEPAQLPAYFQPAPLSKYSSSNKKSTDSILGMKNRATDTSQ